MLKDVLKNTVLRPLLMRLGTIGAVWLVAGGQWLCDNWNACGLVTEAGADMVLKYVLAVGLLCMDLAFEFISKRGNR